MSSHTGAPVSLMSISNRLRPCLALATFGFLMTASKWTTFPMSVNRSCIFAGRFATESNSFLEAKVVPDTEIDSGSIMPSLLLGIFAAMLSSNTLRFGMAQLYRTSQ